jgi:serine/threonine-protein kinase
MTVDAARAALEAEGLALGTVTPTPDETVPLDQVIGADFTEPTALPGTEIPIRVSTGPAPRLVPPELVGQPYATTEAKFAELGITPTQVPAFSDTVPTGSVIGFKTGDGAADIVPGQTEVARGSTVQVIVSQGPAPRKVPPILGRTVEQARQLLIQNGFTIKGVTGDPFGTVVGSDPIVGTEQPFGTAVQLFAV